MIVALLILIFLTIIIGPKGIVVLFVFFVKLAAFACLALSVIAIFAYFL